MKSLKWNYKRFIRYNHYCDLNVTFDLQKVKTKMRERFGVQPGGNALVEIMRFSGG